MEKGKAGVDFIIDVVGGDVEVVAVGDYGIAKDYTAPDDSWGNFPRRVSKQQRISICIEIGICPGSKGTKRVDGGVGADGGVVVALEIVVQSAFLIVVLAGEA